MKPLSRLWPLVLAAVWAMSGSCQAPRSKMFLVLNFDVEDYTTPVAEGIDDIPKWLAETMSEERVTGTFFVIGEKARSLESRALT